MKKLLSIHLIIVLMIANVMVMPVQASTVSVSGGTTLNKATGLAWSSGKYYVTRMTSSKKNYWYRFKTCSDSRFYTITIKNLSKPGYVDYYIKDSSGDSVSKSYLYNGDSREISIKLKSSRYYYIHLVNSSGTDPGNVKFNIKSRKDVVGDTLAAAKSLTLNKSFYGTMDGKGDVDCLKFRPTATGTYKFVVKNCNYKGNMNFKVMDQYQDTLGSRTYYTEKGGTISLKLTGNKWYYVRINGYGLIGTYRVAVTK